MAVRGVGTLGVGLLHLLIPQMGIGPITVFSLAGQFMVTTVASHFGCLDLPQKLVTLPKPLGFLHDSLR